ncbi:ATP-binding protein [uncultured Bacteroides sp.]|uniref:sensor histidine kinase n=1 Tax=uncultured Bacteroides sp. TaxID=162156 RepID=UPI002AA8391E|nr:ATP-binding protein [uncultured Bacteroides sp.]
MIPQLTISQKVRYSVVFGFLFVLALPIMAHHKTEIDEINPGEILFISSYNSYTEYTLENINSFIDTYNKLGGKYSIAVENMNCTSLNEAYKWQGRIARILEKHPKVKLIILLGGEAWINYLQLADEKYKKIPVMCAMFSHHGVALPEDSVQMSSYEPESLDLTEAMKKFNVKLCLSYNYDIAKSIELMKSFYPKMKNLVFLSDNTYNGISLHALVKKELKKYPEIRPIFIDGRKLSLEGAAKRLHDVPSNSVMLLGIWKIDSLEISYINNSVYAFKYVNPLLPVFSLTATGIGYWAIGGYVPLYEDVGKKLGLKAYRILDLHHNEKPEFTLLKSEYKFDVQKLEEMGFKGKVLPEGSTLVNYRHPFFVVYKREVETIFFVFIALIIGLAVSLFYYCKTTKLKNSLIILMRKLSEDKEKLELSQEELRLAKEHAEESSRLKSAFVSNMSHEIRTPLNAIVGFSNLLISTIEVDKEQKEYADIIQTNSDLLLQLISDVLDVSRLESGKLQFHYEECDIVQHCEGMIRLINQSKKNEITVTLRSPLKKYMLKTDPRRLQQVVMNLLNNAIKFTPEGGNITLAFEVDEEKSMVLFSVTDTGCGIPADKQDLVFSRFEKLNEFVQGTGLGLAICKLTVNHMGGDIWIDKDYKDGARFVFSHPIMPKDELFID